MDKSLPLITIVGRPNVGKSTLFNRLAGKRLAIVDDLPGTTRDLYRITTAMGSYRVQFEDSGGFTRHRDAVFAELINDRIRRSIRDSDLVIFVVDAKEGVHHADGEMARFLRKEFKDKPVLLVANKAENEADRQNITEFYRLGFNEPLPVSALHGSRTGDLKDILLEMLVKAGLTKTEALRDSPDEPIRLVVAGRPNTGKSTLVNTFLRDERMIVSDVPGTTRDCVDFSMELDGKVVIMTDTAGLRKKKNVTQGIEKAAVARTLKCITSCDAVVLMIDAIEGVGEQERRIAGFIHESGKSVIIAVNKWDLVDKTTLIRQEYEHAIRYQLKFLEYAPIIFISAKEQKSVPLIFRAVSDLARSASKQVDNRELKQVINEMSMEQSLTHKGKPIRLLELIQDGIRPPIFVLHVNDRRLFHDSYRWQLENRLRRKYGFHGTPVKIIVKDAIKRH